MTRDRDMLLNAAADNELPDFHRNAPRPDHQALHGLVGVIARAGSQRSEANPYAIALNVIAYLGAAIGRGAYLPWGDTIHHARLFTLHVGRSSVARKGDATSLMYRIDGAVRRRNSYVAPQIHRGGLSTREGLIRLIPDAFQDGKVEIPGVDDKRLLVAESEFANVLHQNKRDGNTLSAALRDCWDGGDLKPATKHNPMWVSHPHISVMGAITPEELRSLIASRDLTNGFFNRFLVVFAERLGLVPIPTATPQDEVDEIADQIVEILQFCKADRWVERDHLRMELAPEAAEYYDGLYRGELNENSMGERIAALVQRRAPMVLRLSMLFALCDMTATIQVAHLQAAMAWVRYAIDSVKYIFASGVDEVRVAETQSNAQKILGFLAAKGCATRTAISSECFGKHKSKQEIDDAIDELLGRTPPAILVEEARGATGRSTKTYRRADATSAKLAEDAKSLTGHQLVKVGPVREAGELGEAGRGAPDFLRSLRDDSQVVECPEKLDHSSISPTSQNSHHADEVEEWEL